MGGTGGRELTARTHHGTGQNVTHAQGRVKNVHCTEQRLSGYGVNAVPVFSSGDRAPGVAEHPTHG